MRSYGLLKNARVMQTKELMTLLSNLRIGIANGMIKDKTSADVNCILKKYVQQGILTEQEIKLVLPGRLGRFAKSNLASRMDRVHSGKTDSGETFRSANSAIRSNEVVPERACSIF